MTVHSLGPCCREGCDVQIVLVEQGNRAHIPSHDCKGKLYSTKKRIYTDGY